MGQVDQIHGDNELWNRAEEEDTRRDISLPGQSIERAIGE